MPPPQFIVIIVIGIIVASALFAAFGTGSDGPASVSDGVADALLGPRHRRSTFTVDEMKQGFWYRFVTMLITLPIGLYGIWNLGVGCLTWLGGVMRHNDESKANGSHLFWMGILAMLVLAFVRAFVLPTVFAKKADK